NPVIGFFSSGLGMIPVYRKQDIPKETADAAQVDRHEKAFSSVENSWMRGHCVLIFPEGVSHDNPHLLKLRSGAARMLLQTEARHQFKLGLKYLPVSINYDEKDRPGSRALI